MATVERKQADETQWTFGEETDATGSPISNKSDLIQRSYVTTNFALDENGEKIASESLRAAFSQVFDELNGLWGSGSIDFEVPEGAGLLPIMQAILGDNAPVSTAVQVKTLLPAGTPLTKHVVHDESLIGQANKQVLDTMGRFDQAATLRISLTSAALIAAGTPGTVVVRYDVNGTEANLTASFASTALTAPQTLSLPANAKVVRVTTTGFNAGTFDIEAVVVIVDGHDLTTAAATPANNLSTYPQAFHARVQLGMTPTLTTATTPGTVAITYTVSGGAAQTTTLSFASGALTTAQFAPIPANATITGIAVAGFSDGEADIDAVFPLLDDSFFDNEDNVALGVVKAQDLMGTIAVTNGLAGYAGAYQLTVQASSDATLTSGTTPGTVVINYDQDGQSRSGTLSFPDASKTVAQTFDLPANSEITSVTATGWSDGELDITAPIKGNLVYSPDFNQPGRLRVTLATANPEGSIRVKGLRKVGIATKDWLLLDDTLELDTTGTEILGSKYFRTVLSAEVRDADGNLNLAGTLTLTSEPGGYETVVKVADRILSRYTIEGEVGEIPRLVEGAIFTGATIDNAGTLNVSANVLARRIDHRRTVESRFSEKFTSTMADNPTEFPLVSVGFFSGIGGYLEIDGEAVLFDSSPVTIDSNYDFGEEKNGSLFRPDPERQGRRSVTCVVNARYESGSREEDVFTRWDRKYRDNAAVRARIVQYRWAADGRQKALIWDLPYCEITEPVRVEASSPGSIPITINLKATPDPATTETAEITLTIINDDQA